MSTRGKPVNTGFVRCSVALPLNYTRILCYSIPCPMVAVKPVVISASYRVPAAFSRTHLAYSNGANS